MEGDQLRLSWKCGLAVFGGTILVAVVFSHFGKLELARPTLVSMAIIGVAIAIKWKLRMRMWFWVAMVTIAALHIPLILCVPWTTGWIPALAITPFGIADIAVILAIIKLLEKQFEKTSVRDIGASSPS